MLTLTTLFWSLVLVALINLMRYLSSLRSLLVILRDVDPLLYQYVDGNGFFTVQGQPSKQLRLISYIYQQRYLAHHDQQFIFLCQRLRGQFMLISGLCCVIAVCGIFLWWSVI